MATRTLATNTNLTAVVYSQSTTSLLPADLATIVNSILVDPNISNAQSSKRMVANFTGQGGFGYNGLLVVPCRGVIRLFPGDVVAVDRNAGTNVGWPIVVSADAIANGSWTLT